MSVIGITALEMAEGKPPYGDIHPMRVCIVVLSQLLYMFYRCCTCAVSYDT